MAANNETGVIQPVAEAAAQVHAVGGLIHVDAVQTAGKLAVDMVALGGRHPGLVGAQDRRAQGVGALAFAPGTTIRRRLHGGAQERGLRSGTENLSGIAGFGAAAAAAQHDIAEPAAHAAWRDAAAGRLGRAGAVIVGASAPRLPNTLCVAARGWASSLQVMALDLDGVMISAGSACSSGKVKPSGVLQAMGLDDLALNGLRASSGWDTTEDDWRRFADVWLAALARHQARVGAREFA